MTKDTCFSLSPALRNPSGFTRLVATIHEPRERIGVIEKGRTAREDLTHPQASLNVVRTKAATCTEDATCSAERLCPNLLNPQLYRVGSSHGGALELDNPITDISFS